MISSVSFFATIALPPGLFKCFKEQLILRKVKTFVNYISGPTCCQPTYNMRNISSVESDVRFAVQQIAPKIALPPSATQNSGFQTEFMPTLP